jgi:hypothetical protein
MENCCKQSATASPEWSAFLDEAVTRPSLIMEAYGAFLRYSTGKQLLALWQCQTVYLELDPINSFRHWKELG